MTEVQTYYPISFHPHYIESVERLHILTVTISHRAGFEAHKDKICCRSDARQSMLAFRVVVDHGLLCQQLFSAVRAATLTWLIHFVWIYQNRGVELPKQLDLFCILSGAFNVHVAVPSLERHFCSADCSVGYCLVLLNPCHIRRPFSLSVSIVMQVASCNPIHTTQPYDSIPGLHFPRELLLSKGYMT